MVGLECDEACHGRVADVGNCDRDDSVFVGNVILQALDDLLFDPIVHSVLEVFVNVVVDNRIHAPIDCVNDMCLCGRRDLS